MKKIPGEIFAQHYNNEIFYPFDANGSLKTGFVDSREISCSYDTN